MKKICFCMLIILIIILFYICNNNKISNKSNKPIEIINRFPQRKSIKNIIYNKTIIIGDSRMSLMRGSAKVIDIPKNFIFIAEGGTKINWFKNVAKPDLEYYLDHMNNVNNRINYHVLINMGVNDLDSYYRPESIADAYFQQYRTLAQNYPNIDFYILSVNPINERIIYKYIGKTQLRTNKKIISFNNKLQKNIYNSNIKNMKFCDSYNNIKFSSADGLHYDNMTNQRIIKYMVNKCLDYK